ncbi:MAG TPA: DUF4350 domain-containing protein [Vicinamibacterales bacterium]|nr:DUF4350 domain-containing protein [Vicinamibacterales bacterium]
MTRSRVVGALGVIALVLIVAFIGANSTWEDIPIPTPPKGEAITNPFYAAQRFAEALGATTRRLRVLVVPSPRAVIVVSAWHWDLSEQRQAAIMRWVESGGRLVVDRNLTGDLKQFESWSGIAWDYNEAAADAATEALEDKPDDVEYEACAPVEEMTPRRGPYSLCGLDYSFVRTSQPMEWALRDEAGHQALRVALGRGSVTVINVVPFTHRALFDGDHASLFVDATQLQRGDEVVFLTEDDHPHLLALLWTYGAPAVTLFLMVIAFALWRGMVRFGPTLAPPDPRRRSMAEQIRGSGYFALKFGEGAPLHAAAVRALTEAARRRIPAFARLSRPQKAAALGKATGMNGDVLMSAIDGASMRRAKELPNTLALLESARRQLLNPGA